MAGNVNKRVLKQPDVQSILLSGVSFWKWEDVSLCGALRWSELAVMYFFSAFFCFVLLLCAYARCASVTTYALRA